LVIDEALIGQPILTATDRLYMRRSVLSALREAGYYVACADCNSSTDGIHYVGCSKLGKGSSVPGQGGNHDSR
jgi:hypothetical protein